MKPWLAAVLLVNLPLYVGAAPVNFEWSDSSFSDFTVIPGKFGIRGVQISQSSGGITARVEGLAVGFADIEKTDDQFSDRFLGSIAYYHVIFRPSSCEGPFSDCEGGTGNSFVVAPEGLGIFQPAYAGEMWDEVALNPGGISSVDIVEFLKFDFSEPVNINSFSVSGLDERDRSLWFSVVPSEIDWSDGFYKAVEPFSIVNVSDDFPSRIATYSVGLSDVTSLIIGSPIVSADLIGIKAVRDGAFFLSSLNGVVRSDISTHPEPATVPLPPSVLLLGFGAVAFWLLGRRRRT